MFIPPVLFRPSKDPGENYAQGVGAFCFLLWLGFEGLDYLFFGGAATEFVAARMSLWWLIPGIVIPYVLFYWIGKKIQAWTEEEQKEETK